MESVDRWALSASVGPPPRIAKGQSTPRRSEYCYKVRVHMISFLHEPLLRKNREMITSFYRQVLQFEQAAATGRE